jgi:hypothetical protein
MVVRLQKFAGMLPAAYFPNIKLLFRPVESQERRPHRCYPTPISLRYVATQRRIAIYKADMSKAIRMRYSEVAEDAV